MRGGGIFLLLQIIFGLAFLAAHIYVLVDMLKPTDAAWTAAGQNKTLWIVLWVVGLCCSAPLFDLVFWFAIRPKLQSAEGSGGYPGGYPPQSGGYPPPGYQA